MTFDLVNFLTVFAKNQSITSNIISHTKWQMQRRKKKDRWNDPGRVKERHVKRLCVCVCVRRIFLKVVARERVMVRRSLSVRSFFQQRVGGSKGWRS